MIFPPHKSHISFLNEWISEARWLGFKSKLCLSDFGQIIEVLLFLLLKIYLEQVEWREKGKERNTEV